MTTRRRRRVYARVQTMGERMTACGTALYVRVRADDSTQLTWSDISAALRDIYPDMWGVESFPPADALVDEANIYHVLLFDRCPYGFDLFADRRA